MATFASEIEQGWFAFKHQKLTIEDCPYPRNSGAAKLWRSGWDKAYKNEPWSQPRRKVRVDE